MAILRSQFPKFRSASLEPLTGRDSQNLGARDPKLNRSPECGIPRGTNIRSTLGIMNHNGVVGRAKPTDPSTLVKERGLNAPPEEYPDTPSGRRKEKQMVAHWTDPRPPQAL